WLYILATLLAFTVRGVVPWPFTAALLLRELVVGATIPVLRRYGYGPLPVHYVGKTATFLLLVACPMLLLPPASAAAAPGAGPAGWALAWWGFVLYWVAGVLYLMQFAIVLRTARAERATAGQPPGRREGDGSGGNGAVPA